MTAIWIEAFKYETDDKRFIRAIVRICMSDEFFPTLERVKEAYRRQAWLDDVHERQGRLDGGIERMLLGD